MNRNYKIEVFPAREVPFHEGDIQKRLYKHLTHAIGKELLDSEPPQLSQPDALFAQTKDLAAENIGKGLLDYEPPEFSQPGVFYTENEDTAKKVVERINSLDAFCAKYTAVNISHKNTGN